MNINISNEKNIISISHLIFSSFTDNNDSNISIQGNLNMLLISIKHNKILEV